MHTAHIRIQYNKLVSGAPSELEWPCCKSPSGSAWPHPGKVLALFGAKQTADTSHQSLELQKQLLLYCPVPFEDGPGA